MSSLPYDVIGARPPIIGATPNEDAVNEFGQRIRGDTTKYLLVPDVDFKRPYLAVPGENVAFVWPLAVEGFEISVDTQLGIHRYLGDVQLDVSITHQDERHISLSGKFPGHTSQANMEALMRVYAMDTPASGKILSLPGVLTEKILVVGENARYTHAQGDFTADIDYNISFVRVGTNAASQATFAEQSFFTSSASASVTGERRGRGTNTFVTTVAINTLRRAAQFIFRDASRWIELYTMNGDLFDDNSTPTHLIPNAPIPVGTTLYY